MRVRIIFLYLLICTIIQAQSASNIEEDPYYECLKIHFNSLKEQKVLNDTMYVQQKDFLKNFSGKLDGVVIVMVDEKFVRERTKKNKSLWVISIGPIMIDEKICSVSVIDFGISRKRNHYKMINNGGTKIKIEYDCNRGRYKYEIVGLH